MSRVRIRYPDPIEVEPALPANLPKHSWASIIAAGVVMAPFLACWLICVVIMIMAAIE